MVAKENLEQNLAPQLGRQLGQQLAPGVGHHRVVKAGTLVKPGRGNVQ
jgi:hypothetical protein